MHSGAAWPDQPPIVLRIALTVGRTRWRAASTARSRLRSGMRVPRDAPPPVLPERMDRGVQSFMGNG